MTDDVKEAILNLQQQISCFMPCLNALHNQGICVTEEAVKLEELSKRLEEILNK